MIDKIVGYNDHDFGPDFENVIIQAVLKNPEFMGKFKSVISPDAFIDDTNKFVVRIVQEHYELYGDHPMNGTLSDVVRRSHFRNKADAIAIIENSSPCENITYIRDRIINWAKWTAIEDVLSLGIKDPGELSDSIQHASKVGDNLMFTHTSLDVDTERERKEVIPTPWGWLNDQLEGGPEIGDLGVVITVIGGGKTTILCNILKHALLLGKSVVYFTFEDGERKIKRRIMQSICQMTKKDMANDHKAAIKRRNRFLTKHGGTCEIKDLTTRISSVNDAAAFIRTVEEIKERKVDLVVTDYADRFKPVIRTDEPRHALREIFEDCKAMAKSLEIVHWTARQVNKSMVGKDTIGYENVSESWGSMEAPDIVVGFGRTLEDEQRGSISAYTSKARDAEAHQKRDFAVDFAKQRVWDPLEEKSNG
ncbi:AAA family ATPase [Candidatus Pacearchaeota archaeon]|nr:AAA family ATPase [Candidatus Pacearchaeota archaeon]